MTGGMESVEFEMLELVHPENFSLEIVLLSTFVIKLYKSASTRNILDIEWGKLKLPIFPMEVKDGVEERSLLKSILTKSYEPIRPLTAKPLRIWV